MVLIGAFEMCIRDRAKGASVKVRQDEEEDERPITYRPAERKGGDILNVMLDVYKRQIQ